MTDGSAAGPKKLYKNIKGKMNDNQKEITHFLFDFKK